MTVLQGHAGVTTCERARCGVADYIGDGIQNYLTQDGRALAVDYLNIPRDRRGNWARYFDEVRAKNGNDRRRRHRSGPRAGRLMNNNMWYHYVISPDPDDRVELSELRELACAWAREFFGDVSVAIAYHDDNERGIPHAHVIVNNTHLRDGKKVHVSRAEARRMNVWLQEESAARGLSWFMRSADAAAGSKGYVNVKGERARARGGEPDGPAPGLPAGPAQDPGAVLTARERNILSEKRTSWKQELRDWVRVACMLAEAPGMAVFLERLGELGVRAEVDETGGDIMYHHPNGKKVRGSTLGRGYTVGGVEGKLHVARAAKPRGDGRARAILCAADVTVVHDQTGFSVAQIAEMRKAVGAELRDVAAMLECASTWGLGSLADFDRQIARLEKQERERGEKPADPRAARAESTARKIEALRAARTVAATTGMYPATAPRRKPKEERRDVPLAKKVEYGYRLTKEEHAKVRASAHMYTRWLVARRRRSLGLDPRPSGHGGSRRQPAGGSAPPRAGDAPSRGRSR